MAKPKQSTKSIIQILADAATSIMQGYDACPLLMTKTRKSLFLADQNLREAIKSLLDEAK